jgi:hypothetical protein
VQTNWCNLTPKAIHTLPTLPSDKTGEALAGPDWESIARISGGLMVREMVDPSQNEGDAQAPFVGWVVTDFAHSRDAPADEPPSWAFTSPLRFENLGVCGEDNAIVVTTTRVGQYSRRLGGTLVYCRIHVFLALPDWREGGVNVAVPHPEATPVEVCGLWNAGNAGYDHEGVVEWVLSVSPGIAEVGIAAFNGWVAVDWRTGKQVTVSWSSAVANASKRRLGTRTSSCAWPTGTACHRAALSFCCYPLTDQTRARANQLVASTGTTRHIKPVTRSDRSIPTPILDPQSASSGTSTHCHPTARPAQEPSKGT